jgi:hypothetical protein
MQRLLRATIATGMTLGLAAPAGAAPHPDPAPYPHRAPRHHSRHRQHRSRRNAKHSAHKTDISGYEFELTVEGAHPLTGDEELGNQAAVEAAEHPGPPSTPLEEETSIEAER